MTVVLRHLLINNLLKKRKKMIKKVLVILGSLLTIIWGIAHLIPTSSVVKGFGNISIDNIRLIQMEWINEGLTLIFIGLLVLLVTILENNITKIKKIVYIASAIMLFSMAILSLFTGFKIDFIPFRLCPIIFSVSGVFILQGVFTKK